MSMLWFDSRVIFLSLGPAEVIACMENEYHFNSEVALDATSYMWQDKYKPRKPRFFNRVHMVCGWGRVCVCVWVGGWMYKWVRVWVLLCVCIMHLYSLVYLSGMRFNCTSMSVLARLTITPYFRVQDQQPLPPPPPAFVWRSPDYWWWFT